MVIWLFAGGGESEIRGLVPFLEKYFSNCSFHRKTPVIRKPGPRPKYRHGIKLGYGKTGKSLEAEIKKRLKRALSKGGKCDKILVIDDLDCRNEFEQKNRFIDAIDSVEASKDIDKFIGFAAPELEAWIIADWNNSIAIHPNFRKRHKIMQYWLSKTKKVSFDNPESFGVYDRKRDTCDEKISNAIIESSMIDEEDKENIRYSKGYHTPMLLQKIDPEIVKDKCPLFRQLFYFLNDNCK
jgi:hypothetical protein